MITLVMKICQWNLQDLIIYMTMYENQNLNKINDKDWQNLSISIDQKNKSIYKIRDMAKKIRTLNSEIFAICEVGGKESLDNFNKYFLNDKYKTFCYENNSPRALDVGFLVKKKSNIEIVKSKNVLLSSKDIPLSRSVGELHIRKNSRNYILLSVHLKSLISKRSKKQNFYKRLNEIKALKKYTEILKKEHPRKEIIVCGDFNSSDSIINEIKNEFVDFHDLKGSSRNQRYSHIAFKNYKPIKTQLDYIFVSKKLSKKLILDKCRTYRLRNSKNKTVKIKERRDRLELCSDHYPLILMVSENKTFWEKILIFFNLQ